MTTLKNISNNLDMAEETYLNGLDKYCARDSASDENGRIAVTTLFRTCINIAKQEINTYSTKSFASIIKEDEALSYDEFMVKLENDIRTYKSIIEKISKYEKYL